MGKVYEINGVALDLGGVIRCELEEWAPSYFACEQEEIQRALKKAWQAADTVAGLEAARLWAKTLIGSLGLDIDLDKLIKSASESITFIERDVTIDMLERLKSAGIRCCVASNDLAFLYDSFFVKRSGLEHYFCASVISCFAGVTKRKIAFYEEVSRAIGLPNAQVIFVEDRPGNCRRAAEHGFLPLLVDRGPQYLTLALERCGLIS